MKIKPSYFVIPAIVVCISLLGQYFTSQWMERYATLQLNSLTPPGYVIGIVWTIIFILSTLSALLFWNKSEHDKKFGIAISLFIDNALLNVLRSWLFFVKHWVLASIIEMGLLFIVTVLLILAVWNRAKWSWILLIPYALWLIIATFLAFNVLLLN